MKLSRFGLSVSAAALLIAGVIASEAVAHSPSDPASVGDVSKLVSAANVVFHGKVKNVAYRLSAGANAIPYSYVTYQVTSVLRGQAGSEITLRFLGGTDGRGGFMSVEGVPTFKVGDEDVLFVSHNGESSGCALVMCEFGRYRVLDGAVYEAHGSPVKTASASRISASGEGPDELGDITYPAPSFDDMMKNPSAVARLKALGLSEATARARYNAEAPDMIVMRARSGSESARAQRSKGLALGSFLASVKTGITAAPARAAASLASADPTRRIDAPAVQPAAPPN